MLTTCTCSWIVFGHTLYIYTKYLLIKPVCVFFELSNLDFCSIRNHLFYFRCVFWCHFLMWVVIGWRYITCNLLQMNSTNGIFRANTLYYYDLLPAWLETGFFFPNLNYSCTVNMFALGCNKRCSCTSISTRMLCVNRYSDIYTKTQYKTARFSLLETVSLS